MRRATQCFGLFLLGVTAACSGSTPGTAIPSSGSEVVRGTISTTARHLDNARAVALSSDGHTYWAYLDTHAGFSLALPSGPSYRLLVANELPSGKQVVVGHVVVHPSAGASRWIGLHGAPSLDLGVIGGKRTLTSASLHVLDDAPDGKDDGAGDGEADDHEDDGESKALCQSQDASDSEDDDVELDAQNDPGDSASDDDAAEHEGESGDDAEACPPGSTGGGATSGGGGGSAGSSCHVSADCAVGLTCWGSQCVRAY